MIQIGDIFIIKNSECKYPDEQFEAFHIENDSVFFYQEDKDCHCKICCSVLWPVSINREKYGINRQWLIKNIEIVETKIEKDRQVKINKILENGSR